MRKPKQARPLRLREYEAAIAALKVQHPWIARQIVEPAPGHLAVVAHLFAQVEYLLPPAVLARKGSLSVSCNRDRLAIHYQPPRRHSERAAAVFDLIAQTKHLSQQQCPVCGAQVIGDGIRPQRCPQHEGIQGLFAEEVRRSRQLIVEQGVQQVVRDLGKVTTEDVRAATVVEDEPVPSEAEAEQVQEQPTESAQSVPLPSIVFLDEAGLEAFVDRHRPKGDDKFRRAQAMAERIKRAGHGRRQLGLLPPDWKALLDEFAQAFPNFHELAELLRDHFALSSLGDGRVSWPAVLLVGPAGIGKTEGRHAGWPISCICLFVYSIWRVRNRVRRSQVPNRSGATPSQASSLSCWPTSHWPTRWWCSMNWTRPATADRNTIRWPRSIRFWNHAVRGISSTCRFVTSPSMPVM